MARSDLEQGSSLAHHGSPEPGRSPWASGAVVARRYRLERLLGEGGMGFVWSATHTLTGTQVALKFLKATLGSAEASKRFLREARVAAAVRHPSIIDVYDVIELEDGSPVLVMELLSGESLAERLKRDRRLPLEEVAAILLQVASGVGAAHALGVVHRDLKPENIFLVSGSSERVKVLDFGVAKLTAVEGDAAQSTALTTSGTMLGTLFYMAPEQAAGERDIDHRADIWSLGLILYECLTGVLPTRAENIRQVFKSIMLDSIAPLTEHLPYTPADVVQLASRMLSRERDARLADLNEVARVLSRHAGASAPSFGPPAALPRYPDAETRHLAQRLDDARKRRTKLQAAGAATAEIDAEILALTLQLREGGRLRAGDALGDGRYLLLEPIGRRAVADLWRALDRDQGEIVAIEVLHAGVASEPARRERFVRAARAMAALDHPAIAHVPLPHGEDGDFHWLVMEHVRGGDLRSAVLAGKVSPSRAIQIVRRAGEALAFAHARGVVHGGVEPATVLLDETGEPRLVDFDFAAAREPRAAPGGASVYTAPECLDRPEDADARADVYGLGMTAVFCLRGSDLPPTILREPWLVLDALPCSQATRDALRRAIARDRDARLAGVAELCDALRNAAVDGPTLVRSPAQDAPPEPPMRFYEKTRPEAAPPLKESRCLLLATPEGGVQQVPLGDRTSIGRSTKSTIQLYDSLVSKHHCIIHFDEGRFHIEDLNSLNGTFVDGTQVHGKVPLGRTHQIRVGNTHMRFWGVND